MFDFLDDRLEPYTPEVRQAQLKELERIYRERYQLGEFVDMKTGEVTDRFLINKETGASQRIEVEP